MNKTPHYLKTLAKVCVFASCLGWTVASQATQLIKFPFNEGQGMKATDSASGLTGLLGAYLDPAVDYVELTSSSPTGQPGDGSITTHGSGFLVAQDTDSILAITNGPITLEAWVYIPPIGTNNPGIVGYGNSYKMGLRGGSQVFTLFGLKDITNSVQGFIFDSQWVHLAAAWDPGVGVHFYVDGVHNFVEYTNNAVARSPLTNILGIGSETLGNNWVGSLDRVRIHHALLDATQIDSDAANPKPPIPGSTLVAYNFDEAAFPSTSAVTPPLPTAQAYTIFPTNSYLWTNDSPAGASGDYALFFPANTPVKESVNADYGSANINLGQNNTNYTLQAWVKVPALDAFEERRVIFITSGPGPRVALSINNNRTLHTTVFGTEDFLSSVALPNDGRWHHVAVVMTNFAQAQFHLDGILRQSVARTKSTAASTSGAAFIRIGKESDTRYFHGGLDRVILDNEALAISALDYPAKPGLATFATLAAHPVSVVTNSGSDVVFSATPTSGSAATYQWVYRTNLADTVAIPLAGKTSTTLTLNAITATNVGFYSLLVSNAAGVSESYSAQLSLPLNLAPKLIDFEAPSYISGLLEQQDGWTGDVNYGSIRVLSAADIQAHLEATERPVGQPVHSGSQAVLFTGAGVAANSFRSFTGLETETNVTLSLWFRALAPGNTGAPIGNVFLRMQNSTGVNAAGFRVGPNLSIDYGLVSGAWVPTGLIADPATWYQITMKLNYATKTYDFFVDGAKINTNPIPFYTGTSDKFTRINLFKGAGQAGIILDDLKVEEAVIVPTLGIRNTQSGVVLFWPASITGFVLEGTDNLSTPVWQTVTHSTVGNENQATVQPTATKFYRLRK
jgi:hypothetical protein